MKLLNRLDKAVAFFLVIALLLSSFTFTTFAKDDSNSDDDSSGDGTTETTTKTSITTTDLLGNYDWTDLDGTSVTSNSLADGIYVNEQDENYLYLMFVNKQASNNKYYRTVGFTVHPWEGSDCDSGSEDSIRIMIPESYPSGWSGTHLTATYEDVIEYGSPDGKTITSSNQSLTLTDAASNEGEDKTTVTCFKISLKGLETAIRNNLDEGANWNGTKLMLNAIQIFNGYDDYNHYYKYTPTHNLFDIRFSDRTRDSLETYYEIPVSIPPSALNAVTVINVGGSYPEHLGTATEALSASNAPNYFDSTRLMSSGYKAKIKTDPVGGASGGGDSLIDICEDYRIVGAMITPYQSIGAEPALQATESGWEFREFSSDSLIPQSSFINYIASMGTLKYFENYSTLAATVTDRINSYLNSKYNVSNNEYSGRNTSSEGKDWLYQGSEDTISFSESIFTTSVPASIEGVKVTNTHNKCGTQLYLFVAPTASSESNPNLVIYNDATGEALATGTVHYDVWYQDLIEYYSNTMDFSYKDTSEGLVTLDDTSGLSNDSTVNITGQTRYLENNITSTTGVQTTAAGSYYFASSGYVPYDRTTYHKTSASNLMLKFPSKIKTAAGNTLQFKSADAYFGVTVAEDIEITKDAGKGGGDNIIDFATDIFEDMSPDDETGYYNFDFGSLNSGDATETLEKMWSKDTARGFYSNHRYFTLPTVGTGIYTYDSSSESTLYNSTITFCNRYLPTNLPWNAKITYKNGTNTFSNVSMNKIFRVLYGKKVSGNSSSNFQYDFSGLQKSVSSETYEKNSRLATDGLSSVYDGLTLKFDYKDSSDSATTWLVPAGNYADPTSKYIIRATYEPITTPVLYYYKDANDSIHCVYTDTTSRSDSCTVKNVINSNDYGKLYPTQVSYRTKVTANEDITKTSAATSIMDSTDKGVVQAVTISIPESTYDSSDDYVIRVELSNTNNNLNSAAEYEIGTFQIPSKYLAYDAFSWNSAPNVSDGDGAQTQEKNSDNKQNKVGILNPNDTNYTDEYGDKYNAIPMIAQHIWSTFNHKTMSSRYRAHNNGSTKAGYALNTDGNPFTGAITLLKTEIKTSSDGDEYEVATPVPCEEEVSVNFSNITTAWSNAVEEVFNNNDDSLIIQEKSQVNSMGGSFSSGGKSIDGNTYVDLGNGMVNEDTNGDTEEEDYLSPGLIKTIFGFNFASSKAALGFKPLVASYNTYTNPGTSSLADWGYENNINYKLDNGSEFLKDKNVEGTFNYDYTADGIGRFIANLLLDDNVDPVQQYSVTDSHKTDSKVEDTCDSENDSDELANAQYTYGTFGGYVVAENTYKAPTRTKVEAPTEPTSTETEIVHSVTEPLIIYPYYPMYLPDSPTDPVPILSPEPITIDTNAKLKISEVKDKNSLSLKAILQRGEDNTLAAGSAYQYIKSGSDPTRTLTIDYIYANPAYVANADAYNAEVDEKIRAFVKTICEDTNYSADIVTNIKHAFDANNAGIASKYLVNFKDKGFTLDNESDALSTKTIPFSSSATTNYEDLVNPQGCYSKLVTGTGDYNWYVENFDFSSALVHHQYVINLKLKTGDSETAVVYLEEGAPLSNSSAHNNFILSSGEYLINDDKKYGTSVAVHFKDAVTKPEFFGHTIDFNTYTEPVYFSVNGTVYDYRE